MMRVGLICCDRSKFPNLPLMKLSAFHKSQGDFVEWYNPFNEVYDRVYISRVFTASSDFLEVVNAREVIRGGSGFAITVVDGREVYGDDIPLSYEVEHQYPDYGLYGITDTAYGFLSRGCPRGCSFCIVGQKEGRASVKVADLSEFWSGQRNLVLCDPNILACREWESLLIQVADSKACVDFNQGLDARLLRKENIDLLNSCRLRNIHFAWDRFQDKDLILSKLELYAEYGNIKAHRHNIIVYTIVNYDTSFEQDLERVYLLRSLGYWPYIMVYDKVNAERRYKDLQRWVNNRFIFAKCSKFEDYISSII